MTIIMRDPVDYPTMRELTDEEMEVLKSYLWADSGGGDATSAIFSDEMGVASIFVEDDCILSGLEPALKFWKGRIPMWRGPTSRRHLFVLVLSTATPIFLMADSR